MCIQTGSEAFPPGRDFGPEKASFKPVLFVLFVHLQERAALEEALSNKLKGGDGGIGHVEGGWEERGVAHGNLPDLIFMFVKQSQEKKFLDSQSSWNLFLKLLREILCFPGKFGNCQ